MRSDDGARDSGRCPYCGADMRATHHVERFLDGSDKLCSGRFRHMRHEHGILEDYSSRSTAIAADISRIPIRPVD
jgi:hypothetical protein